MGNFAGPSSEPALFIKTYLCRLFLGRQLLTPNVQQSANNEYNQCNLLIDSVPLSAQKNNYLMKLIILLNKTGLLPRPANFPSESVNTLK